MFSVASIFPLPQGPDPLSGDEPARIFGADLSDSERRALVMKAYETLKSQWERFRRPDGGRDFPAKTCRDLHVARPELPSGEYWVDPNEGDARDAILVYCDMTAIATCLYPQPNRTPEITYVGEEQEIWVTEVEGGMEVSVSATRSTVLLETVALVPESLEKLYKVGKGKVVPVFF